MAVDKRRAFELAKAGAAHSKGALGRCYVRGHGVAVNEARGLALGRESEAAGSCFGQYVVRLYKWVWGGVAQDYTEAVRLHTLSSSWASCLSLAKVLRRTEPRPSDCTASPPHRGMQPLRMV